MTAHRSVLCCLFSFNQERLINCQSPRWYYHLSYNITPRTDLDVSYREELLGN